MSVLSDAAEEELYAAHGLDELLIVGALCMQIMGVSIKNVDLGGRDVDCMRS